MDDSAELSWDSLDSVFLWKGWGISIGYTDSNPGRLSLSWWSRGCLRRFGGLSEVAVCARDQILGFSGEAVVSALMASGMSVNRSFGGEHSSDLREGLSTLRSEVLL